MDKKVTKRNNCNYCFLEIALQCNAESDLKLGGFNPKKPKKPKISLKSHFGCWVFWGFLGFNWIFLRTFKKNVMKVFLPTVMLL